MRVLTLQTVLYIWLWLISSGLSYFYFQLSSFGVTEPDTRTEIIRHGESGGDTLERNSVGAAEPSQVGHSNGRNNALENKHKCWSNLSEQTYVKQFANT